MPDRAQRVTEAERALRRGELREALEQYRALLAEAPDDPAVRARIAAIESLVQPKELAGGPAVPQPVPTFDLSRPPTLEQTAEMLFERGDVPAAIATYRRILQDRPDHDLARERCAELLDLHALSPHAPPSPALPRTRPELLEALLTRIASRRKG